jgi:hypothetical protein
MILQASSWSAFYKDLSSNLEINLKMQSIADFNLPTVSEDIWISNLSKNPGLSLLLVDGFGKLVLLHNVSYLQQNIFCSESKALGLFGDSRQAEVYRIDPTSASKSIEFQVPSWRDLKSSQSIRDIDALSVPDQNPTVARLNQSLWIPPLVLNSILELKSLVPAELIPILSAKFQEFDRSSTTVKACTILRPVLEFLWGVHKKLVLPTIIAVDTSNDATEWAARLHFAYIRPEQSQVLPPPFPAPPVPSSLTPNTPFEVMTDELRKIREANEKHLLHEAQTSDLKKETNGWEKMPDIVQNMILKLSATQDDVLPLEPCESYQKILKQSKVLGAATVINLELALRKCQVDLPTAMANAIRTGNFRANSFMVAHSFSIFNVPFTDAANMTSCNKTELDILEDGLGIPLAIAKKLSENKFHAPSTTYLLRHQFNNWYGILQICFGNKSLIAREAKSWIIHVDENELAYNARFKGDAEFGAKLLGAIDLAFFNLCDSCFRASTIHDVDYSKNCLSHLRDDILGNRFHEGLPSYLLSELKSTRELDDTDPSDQGKIVKKTKDLKDGKDRFKDLGEMVKNTQAVQDWILPGGKYKSLFTKDVISTTPPFNDSGLITCNKWHVRGFCYEKCDRKNSHKKFESNSHKATYDMWIKALKAKLP